MATGQAPLEQIGRELRIKMANQPAQFARAFGIHPGPEAGERFSHGAEGLAMTLNVFDG